MFSILPSLILQCAFINQINKLHVLDPLPQLIFWCQLVINLRFKKIKTGLIHTQKSVFIS